MADVQIVKTVERFGTLDRVTEYVSLHDNQGNVGPQTIVLHQFIGTTAVYCEHGSISIDDEYVPELIDMLKRSVKRRADEIKRKDDQKRYEEKEARRKAKAAGK